MESQSSMVANILPADTPLRPWFGVQNMVMLHIKLKALRMQQHGCNYMYFAHRPQTPTPSKYFNFFRTWSFCISNKMQSRMQQHYFARRLLTSLICMIPKVNLGVVEEMGFMFCYFKEIYLSKGLTCMNFFLYKQNAFLSRRRIPLATLL